MIRRQSGRALPSYYAAFNDEFTRSEDNHVHLEKNIFIFFVCLCLNLLCKLDDRLKVGIVLFVLCEENVAHVSISVGSHYTQPSAIS